MLITNLTFLALYINSALDTGKYDNISLQEVANHIEAETIFDFLRKRLLGDIDLSTFDAIKEKELVTEWQDMLLSGRTFKTYGVENKGLCLLMAYLLECIQCRQDNNPKH